MRWLSIRALALALLIGLPQVSFGARAEAFEGLTVTQIELRSDVEKLSLERLYPLLAVAVGQPFKQQDLSRSLRNLQASGLVGEVEADARETSEGVAISLAMWGRVQVEEIVFKGELEVKKKELRSVVAQKEGEPLVSSRIVRGVYDLENFYHRLGYLDVAVRSRPEIDRQAKTARVVFEIEPGPRFTVGAVSFEGPTAPFSASQLQNQLRMGVGKIYRPRGARADTERLELWLFSQGHREARVGSPTLSIDWQAATVDISHNIDVGPRFLVEIHGAEERRMRRKGLLPFLKNQRYDEAILLQSVGKIETYFQERGHYDVDVDWSETRTGDLVHLVMTIDPGSTYELAEIRFEGNEAVSTYELLNLVSTESKKFLAAGSGRLSDSALEDDVDNILSYYRIQGYWDALVGPPVVTAKEHQLSVLIPVKEGLQRRLVNLTFEGVKSLDEADLRPRLSLTPGGPFHPILLEETTNAIRASYRSRGFESMQLSSTVDWDKDEILADVSFKILEGPRSVVDRIVLRGNQRTRPKAIQDALNLRPGEFLSTARLLEAQTNLYRLEAFSSVEVKRAPGTPFRGERDVLVEVEEGSRHSFTYGFGLDTDEGFTGLLGYTRSNMFGRGFTGRLDLRVGRDTLARLLVNQPFFGRRRITTTGSVFYIEETRDSFESLRRGGQLEAQRIGNSSRTGLLLDYRLVDQLDLVTGEALDDPLAPADRDLEEIQIASLTPNWQLDHRNSPVDPIRGWSTNLQVQYAFPLFQADEEFLKSFVQYTQFYDLGRLGSLGSSLRLGAIEPLKDPIADADLVFPTNLDSFLIPISQRYFAGGSTTHRAYRRDTLGICGETLVPIVSLEDEDLSIPEQCLVATDYGPLGGNGQLLLNLDYRFPIVGPVLGDLFFDTGNVWSSWRNIDLSEIKSGVGVGIRYISPVGPIRLEAGWKLDRLPGEDPYVIFFSVGNAY